jgi:hypothetical protein
MIATVKTAPAPRMTIHHRWDDDVFDRFYEAARDKALVILNLLVVMKDGVAYPTNGPIEPLVPMALPE